MKEIDLTGTEHRVPLTVEWEQGAAAIPDDGSFGVAEPDSCPDGVEQLRALLKGKHSSLSLTFNDRNGPNYCTVAEYVERYGDEDVDWVSPEERQQAIDGNSWWSLQWYPDTPVGFFTISASSADAIFAYIAQ